MRLPGGIFRDGVRRRDFAFRTLTGAVELALAEAAGSGATLPARVTAALAATLEHIGGEAPSLSMVAGLAVADRQFLMGRLATGLGLGENWLTARCGRCGEQFDLSVTNADLPVKEAGEGYPFTAVETSIGPCSFRIPTGNDQEFLAPLDDGEAFRCLVNRCLVDFAGQPAFTDDDVAQIESALEAVAPEVAVAVQAACPACGTTHVIDVDPYAALSCNAGGGLLQEIHILAATYHWSEGEILALPLERRRRYLELIDRARGMAR